MTATRVVTAPYGRLVRGPLSFDDVEELELAAETPEQRRTATARLVAWSEEPHPEDDAEVTPAMLLAHAGELLTTVGTTRPPWTSTGGQQQSRETSSRTSASICTTA